MIAREAMILLGVGVAAVTQDQPRVRPYFGLRSRWLQVVLRERFSKRGIQHSIPNSPCYLCSVAISASIRGVVTGVGWQAESISIVIECEVDRTTRLQFKDFEA